MVKVALSVYIVSTRISYSNSSIHGLRGNYHQFSNRYVARLALLLYCRASDVPIMSQPVQDLKAVTLRAALGLPVSIL